ncbi:MAG TPA: alpha/beta hydrolase-fold protein [Cyclobacteriaceae bacterium]|nr:alpha/beta hydrolase-fold protein [Cyclobacteriaceae bacterium]
MNRRLLVLAALMPTLVFCQSPLPKSSNPNVKGPFNWVSKIYPATERNYWIYVPAQYDSLKPACSMIVQDGLGRANEWNLPNVLDSLIAIKAIPVMIGIFIDPGKVPSSGSESFPRYNRSLEYDGMGDRYARFLLEEILPEISKKYNLSTDPNDRSLAGASSGAICAFNAAWERPDAFRRVFSTIGTYVGLRGGDTFATLVRKSEAKPIRIFLQDGDHDLNIYAGDWWMANQDMLSALTYSGYKVNHAWGTGGHDGKHGRAILGEAVQWLWKNYPEPVQTHTNINQRMNLLVENEIWKEIKFKNLKINKIAVGKEGDVFFTTNQSIYKADEHGNFMEYVRLKGRLSGISPGANDKLYVGDLTNHKIVVIDASRNPLDLVRNVNPDYMAVSTRGIYFSETNKSRIGFFSFEKMDLHYTSVTGNPTGLSLSAEQTFLNAGIYNQVLGYSLKILPDGRLTAGQEYIHYHVPYGSSTAAVRGMTNDADNLVYSATSSGIQVSDQLGRVNFIFSKTAADVLDVKIGGKDFNILYINGGGKLYSRVIKARGILSWMPAIKPPQPRM